MKNNDLIQRFIFENANVRGEIVHLNKSFQGIMEQHQYPPAIRNVLGQMLVAANLLSAIIKFKGRLTVQFQGKGPVKLMLAQCTNEFNMRGLAQWHESNLSESDLLNALKNGVLAIIINPDSTTTRYQGIVSWQGNSIAQSIEGYFRDSEQLPTRLWIAINEHSAAGLLIQAMPKSSSDSRQEFLESDLNWEHLVHLTETITNEELLGLDKQTILHRLYSQEQVRVFEPSPVMFQCTCSIERGENAILMLGKEEAEQELKDKQVIAVTCEFCNKTYNFDRVDVAAIFKKGDSSSSSQVH